MSLLYRLLYYIFIIIYMYIDTYRKIVADNSGKWLVIKVAREACS